MSSYKKSNFIIEKTEPKKKKSFKRKALKGLLALTFLTTPLNNSIQRLCLGEEKSYNLTQTVPSWSANLKLDPFRARVSAHYKNSVRSTTISYSNCEFFYETYINHLETRPHNNIIKHDNRLDGL